MGISIDSGSRDGRKAVDADLNLVPFIDLLVCCICFLLITAVWVQMSSVDVSLEARGMVGTKPSVSRSKTLALAISLDGYVLLDGARRLEIPKRGRHYDTATLEISLRDATVRHGNARPLSIAVGDGVKLRDIIGAMDVARREHYVRLVMES